MEILGEPFTPATNTSAFRWQTIAAAGLLALAALVVYCNSFAAPIIFDGISAIEENPTIRRLWPLWRVLSPPAAHGETVGGRPLLNLSLALNYAAGGLDVGGYHAVNLAIHVAVAFLLFGILRRTFLTPVLRDRFGKAATPLALAIALAWTVHPLQTESVTYIVQRGESLAGLLYLLTLYCVIRGTTSCPLPARPTNLRSVPVAALCPAHRCWYVAAVVACLLGMATKETLVTVPLIALVYDRIFLAGSFRGALRQRWGLYLGLAATWILLGYLVLSTGSIGRQPEFGSPAPLSYARSQLGVILYYLRLSAWPARLCLSWTWPVANGFWEIFPGALVVSVLLTATGWAVFRGQACGFLGAWFLLILAPTTSMLPLAEWPVEHRMYLPLAAVVTLVVLVGYALINKLAPRRAAAGVRAATLRWAMSLVVWGAVLAALGCATLRRNFDYRSDFAIWKSELDQHPHNIVAQDSLGLALAVLGKTDEAIEHFHEALRLKPQDAVAHSNMGFVLTALGRTDEAINYYQQALRVHPDYAKFHYNLAISLAKAGRTDEAIYHYRQAIRLEPDYADAQINLGHTLAGAGKTTEAIEHYREALRLKPDYAEAHSNLGVTLAALGKTAEAIEHYREALRLKPDYAEAQVNLGNILTSLGRTSEAIEHYRQALRLKPDYAMAHSNLGVALATLGKTAEAIEHYREALRLKPDYAEAHSNLGGVLANAGRSEEAIEHYQQALRLNPNYAEAHNNLGAILTNMGKNETAIVHYREALRLNPAYVEAHYNFGIALAAQGKTREAIEAYQQALRLKPDLAAALGDLAWLLATHESANGGDAARAVQLAEHARQQDSRDVPQHVDTLAAAYAAAGRFREAVTMAEKAAELAESTGQTALAKRIHARLELYRAGRAYREPAPAAGPANR